MKKIIALLLAVIMIVGTGTGLCGCRQPGTKGKVYYLNPNPEAEDTWNVLAAQYTEQTGVEVRVVTVPSGTYEDVLGEELSKEEPPTLFQCSNIQELERWSDHCLDLTGTEVLAEMTAEEFNLVDGAGAVKAMGYCYEAFGIIVNKALLKQAGYDMTQITDFASLKAVAEDIHLRAGELGFDAFAPMGQDESFTWTYSGNLANLPAYYRLAALPLYYEFRDDHVTEPPPAIKGTYLDAYKDLWDLYLNNSAPVASAAMAVGSETAPNAFAAGQAVFWHQGTWEYKKLVNEPGELNLDELQMIPVYCGVEGEEDAGLCCVAENRWAVNAHAAEEDIQATLAFLKWVVTSDVGTAAMAEQFGPIPFKMAKETNNRFFDDAIRLIAEGKYVVTWSLKYAPDVEQWRLGVASALIDYSAGHGEWSAVKTAFVDGWALQYQQQNR